MLALAAGALVVAVAFELFQPAHRTAGVARASAALLAAATLDGVPDNLALGVGLAESGSYALLASIVVSNLPEAFGGAAQMREGGASSARVLLVWA
jgi:ZIP family zinc transporter